MINEQEGNLEGPPIPLMFGAFLWSKFFSKPVKRSESDELSMSRSTQPPAAGFAIQRLSKQNIGGL